MTEGTAGPITLIVTMSLKPEREAEFLSVATEFVAWVHQNEPGTLLYVLTRHQEREHTYVWVERYRDDAALAAHAGSPQIAEALKTVRECVAGPPEMLRLKQVLPA